MIDGDNDDNKPTPPSELGHRWKAEADQKLAAATGPQERRSIQAGATSAYQRSRSEEHKEVRLEEIHRVKLPGNTGMMSGGFGASQIGWVGQIGGGTGLVGPGLGGINGLGLPNYYGPPGFIPSGNVSQCKAGASTVGPLPSMSGPETGFDTSQRPLGSMTSGADFATIWVGAVDARNSPTGLGLYKSQLSNGVLGLTPN
ncbi:unnamed protein product [Linum trigynum]|uniref:Uncharacterized protein n=1 Tax=Linum trigynum TaxID=586398 RepID=A0AAV2ES88_9ROSI